MSNKFKMKTKKKKEKVVEPLAKDDSFLAGKRVKRKASAQSFEGKSSKSFSTKKV